MPTTGGVPLLEAAKAGTDMVKAGVVETLIQESPTLEMFPFMTIEGNALKHFEEVDLPTPQFRSVNETYSRSFGTDTEHFWGVTILGGEVYIDNYLLKVTANKRSEKAKQWAKFAKAMARTWDKQVFDGTGTAKDFKGFNALISEGFGQIYYTDGSGSGEAELELDHLDEANDLLRGQHMADVILLNRDTRRHITRKARNTSGYFSLIDVGTDVFGRQVTKWNDIPLRIIGDDAVGDPILGWDETVGGDTTTGSLYLVSFGDGDGVTGLLGFGGSWEAKDFGETEAAPGHMGRVEIYPGIAVFNKYALVRVAGIQDPSTLGGS